MALARHLVLFTRCPRLGAGKKRLAAGIGQMQALRFQRVMLAQAVLRLGRDSRWTTWLAVTPDRSGPWPSNIGILPQGGGDLGARMASCARRLPPGPVLIIGADIPGISAGEINRAFRLLRDRTAVFGPAADGGYWAVGLRRRPHFIDPFREVRWSSPHALADTMANLRGEPVAMLEVLEDVDDAASLARQADWESLFARRPRRKVQTFQQQPPPS
ncbi:TIGR04282 family arsenosugar biosynthesis glycosyltransferase [uncultured Rhodoblastus sp.]|uniref:TIGR04282 family arsenosugar biosynthesis glycosyltransferase n=1 Tax=uncultured Rhodoblastus sp. TaxID=543037 RepID=UPI0025F44204|nr:TIGR04282 family arsenosugar biosynthesis glycosyltransferase [uncultured Rhodoblastus sp.]